MVDSEGILGISDSDEGMFEDIGNYDMNEEDSVELLLRLGEAGSRSVAVGEVDLNLSLGVPSSSSAVPVLERGGLDRDSCSKRPKVHSNAL